MKKNLIGIKRLAFRGKFFLLAIVLAVTATIGSLQASKPAHAAIGSITQYTVAVSGANLNNIELGPDGNIWYTATGPTINSRIGKLTTSGTLTEYLNRPTGVNPKTPRAITQGSDGNIWYGEYINSTTIQIVKLSTTGTVLGVYPVTSGGVPMSMVLGPDGNVWFAGGTSGISKITTSGVITQYTGIANSLTVGPDGNIWFTRLAPGTSNNFVGKITTSGVSTLYSLVYNAQPKDITAGSDGNLWFTEWSTNSIVKVTTSGVMTKYTVPTATASIDGITAGSDGALWFTESGASKIGRITTSGIFTEYNVPGAISGDLTRIITGSDGAVWFMRQYNRTIGRVATELTNQTVSFTSASPINATVDSPSYTPAASATSGLPVAITVDSSSSSVCSIDSSGIITYQSAGTCTLNANQGGDADYNPAPQVQQSFPVLPVDADSSVSVSCPSSVTLGSTVTCTVTLANSGPADAENASLTALFSSSLTGASLSGGGALSGQYITWTAPSLVSGSPTTLTLTATASVVGKARFNAALLQTSPDPDISNNIVNATILVL